MNLSVRNPLLAGAMTIGYLDIEGEVDGMLQLISSTITLNHNQFRAHQCLKNVIFIEESRKQRKARLKFLQELSDTLKDCPIRGLSEIVVDNTNGVNVPWAYPNALRAIIPQCDDQETIPKLFNYAQAVLCKRWSETIGFMNLIIETMGLHSGLKHVKFIKFIDSTVY